MKLSTTVRAESKSAQVQPNPRGPRFSRSLWVIVLVAFLLRLATITLGHTYRIRPLRDHFQFGWEMGRLARSIAQGQGFSSPTDLDSGPSAWTAPIYPYILATVFKLFGVYTTASAWVILAFNSVFSSLTCWMLYLLGAGIYQEGVGRAAAWTWAVFPYLIYWPVRVVWEVSFTTFLLCWALWLTTRIAESHRWRDWMFYGCLWGVILLTNTAVVILLPFSLAWLIAQERRSRRPWLGAGVVLLVVALAAVPWTVRNYRVFGRLIFIRDNLPLELHEANNQRSSGLWTRSEHPGNDPLSMRRFQQLGEIGFMEEKRREFEEFVSAHPFKFLGFTLERIGYFWAAPPQVTIVAGYNLGYARHTEFLLAALFAFAGLILMVRRKNPYRWLLAPFLMVYPLPYYLVNPFPRYKHPIEPVMLLLIVYLLWESKSVELWRWQSKRQAFSAVRH